MVGLLLSAMCAAEFDECCFVDLVTTSHRDAELGSCQQRSGTPTTFEDCALSEHGTGTNLAE